MPRAYITQEQRDRAWMRRMLRSWIAREGISQKVLADRIGITAAGLSAAISRGSLSVVQLMGISRMLHLSSRDLADLLGGVNEKEGTYAEV